jgi:hypothetical protein
VERETYDSTNGAKGAFIVAVNCSFGVNEGQPEDFPIWEAMYDSLGELGVLNVAATANRGWDIDEVGDVPTAFATDYMISVTNTTNKDVHYDNSGYGDTTIDLGAPGSLIRSLRINNAYGNSSGTSMATPHVSGAVALLFAAADSTFISNYKNSPGEYALMIKDYILEGVDTLETLVDKTVSGGRLNVFNSMNLLLNAAAMSFDADSVYAELLQDESTQDTLIITNTGGDTLNYALTIEDQPDWLSVNQTEGSLTSMESDNIVFTFNSDNMDTGVYNATVTFNAGDAGITEIPVIMHIFTDVGIGEFSPAPLEVSVYPNPFTSAVAFDIRLENPGNVTLEIHDPTGRNLYKENIAGSSMARFSWDAEGVGQGIYFYRIFLDGLTVRSGKLVRH